MSHRDGNTHLQRTNDTIVQVAELMYNSLTATRTALVKILDCELPNEIRETLAAQLVSIEDAIKKVDDSY